MQLTRRLREQARSHSGSSAGIKLVPGRSSQLLLWEPSLLAIAVRHSALMQADPAPSRAGSLPQWIFSGPTTCARPQFAASPVGAKLARDSGLPFSIYAS